MVHASWMFYLAPSCDEAFSSNRYIFILLWKADWLYVCSKHNWRWELHESNIIVNCGSWVPWVWNDSFYWHINVLAIACSWCDVLSNSNFEVSGVGFSSWYTMGSSNNPCWWNDRSTTHCSSIEQQKYLPWPGSFASINARNHSALCYFWSSTRSLRWSLCCHRAWCCLWPGRGLGWFFSSNFPSSTFSTRFSAIFFHKFVVLTFFVTIS